MDKPKKGHCGECDHWTQDPDIPDLGATIYQIEEAADKGVKAGGSRPGSYGKCRAIAFYPNGEYAWHYDKGTMSNWECSVEGVNGEPLFEPREL